jgi:hypothetical protein
VPRAEEREQRPVPLQCGDRSGGDGPEAHQGRAREAPGKVVAVHIQGRGQGAGAPRSGEAAGGARQGRKGVRRW